jgi:hypothetical protein
MLVLDGYFKSEDFVRYCQWFMPGDAVSTGTEQGRFVRYRKPHAGLADVRGDGWEGCTSFVSGKGLKGPSLASRFSSKSL